MDNFFINYCSKYTEQTIADEPGEGLEALKSFAERISNEYQFHDILNGIYMMNLNADEQKKLEDFSADFLAA